MDLKSFIIGMLSGIALTIGGVFFLAFIGLQGGKDDDIQFLEHPVSYENKKTTSFKVFQVIEKKQSFSKRNIRQRIQMVQWK